MRMRWLARLLLPRLQAWTKDREPNFQVIRGVDRVTYLRRWWVVPRNRFCNVYLHNMLKDDDAVLHDHPYWSLSLVLTDGLDEKYVERPDVVHEKVKPHLVDERFDMAACASRRIIEQGQLVWRGRHFAHQLIVWSPAWTLFITGPRVREWGFWCPRGWRPWHKYVATDQDSSVDNRAQPGHVGRGTSSIGLGCGEQS